MKAPPPYPTIFRVALLAAVTAGALMSFSAAQGVGLAIMAPDAPRDAEVKLGALAGLTPWAKEQEAALQASRRATFAAIESMGAARVVILLGLSATASMVFLGALFLRWSANTPRWAIARLLGRAALAVAFFRTLDGAQELVITRRATDAAIKVLIAAEVPDASAGAGYTLGVISALSVGWTAFVVALFLALGGYFKSEKVRSLLSATSGDEG
ncbi:MAG: hypothetical protein IT380_18230 [Myxococcales bacterium]|nr:hypothetical protein [Myxococcales bacterium]